MSDAVGAAVLELSDRLIRLGSLVGDGDWARPTPWPRTDVRALAGHLPRRAGPPRRGLHRLAHACRYVWDYTPQLFVRDSGAEDRAVRIVLRGTLDHDADLVVRERGLWTPMRAAASTPFTATPGGEAFVRTARLPG